MATTNELNLDTAFFLSITGLYEGHSFQFTLYRFQDKDCTLPENWPAASYTLAIADNPKGEPVLMSLTSASGITTVSNALTVMCTDGANLLKGTKPNRPYYYDLVADYGSGNTCVEGRGTITVNYAIGK